MYGSFHLFITDGKMGFEAHVIVKLAITRHFLTAEMAGPVFSGFN